MSNYPHYSLLKQASKTPQGLQVDIESLVFVVTYFIILKRHFSEFTYIDIGFLTLLKAVYGQGVTAIYTFFC